MNKLLVQWVLVISSIILVTGCTSGGSNPSEEEKDARFAPLPSGLPVFAEINEPYLNKSSDKDSDALSLFSYKTQASALENATQTEIFSASTDIIVSLNTVEDQTGRTEFTLLVKNDSVYLVNHLNNEIRLLNHFINTVCELIPRDIVSVNDSGPEKILTVLHDELVYVMTAEPGSLTDDCLSDSKKRFYELPLDYQLDPSLDGNGELTSLSLVKESKARAQLIFGWVPDPLNPNQEVMDYGYLGYAVEEQELSLFDQNGEYVWTQDRTIQEFEQVAIAAETLSDNYIFHIQALENQQYLIQLGLDVFVVDGGVDLLSKDFDETETVLNDKVMSVDMRVKSDSADEGVSYAVPVKAFYDTDDLLLVDNAMIYRLAYQDSIPARNPTITTRIVGQNRFTIENKEYLSNAGFSQFDLEPCDPSDLDCTEAHDVEAQSWQFLTRCETQFGCIIPANTADVCETREENLQTDSEAPLCTPSNYEHLAELNKPENDAELLAYMQYAKDYTRHIEYILQNNRLFMAVQMNEKDIFLAYDFNQDFSAAKSLREQVLFGERAVLTGMDAYFSNNNLFLTALQKGALRSNECYKNGQKLPCDLSELNESGGTNSCTGEDIEGKLCTNRFNEYESKAIFCTANQIADLSCSDAALNQLDSLTIENSDEDAKWLPLYDYVTKAQLIYLLVGDHTLALESGNLDEGKLYAPSLYSVDPSTGQKNTRLASMSGSVEQVVGGWLAKDKSLGVAEVFGRINVITEEISQDSVSNSSPQSKLSTYMLEQTFENSISTEPDVIKVPKVAERLFDRF